MNIEYSIYIYILKTERRAYKSSKNGAEQNEAKNVTHAQEKFRRHFSQGDKKEKKIGRWANMYASRDRYTYRDLSLSLLLRRIASIPSIFLSLSLFLLWNIQREESNEEEKKIAFALPLLLSITTKTRIGERKGRFRLLPLFFRL